MNSLFGTLGTVAFCLALIGCGGSGDGGTPDRQTLGITDADKASVVANDGSQLRPVASSAIGVVAGAEQSLLLEGPVSAASGLDLTITNVQATATERGINYSFSVAETGDAFVSLDNLSIALEVAGTGSFADSYRVPLYDIREADDEPDISTLTARSAGVDLPAGSYDARLVVNPNWQNFFESIPSGHGDTQPYRYIIERDYSNNASNLFTVSADGGTVCSEDIHENNDDVATATPIAAGARVEASLCLDDVDYFSVVLSEFQVASLIFAYTDAATNPNPATRYVVLDSNFNRITEPTVAREANRIVINATNAGRYYVAMFGKRSSYRITRTSGSGFAADASKDSLFHAETISGPQSWLYGGITLHRLAFTEATLSDQVINCGRITTQYSNNQPVAYVTPDHFAEIHEFRFLSGSGYLVDGERRNGWHVQDGDISHGDWYDHGYPGYAENTGRHSWRYWSNDGLGYVDCALEVNR